MRELQRRRQGSAVFAGKDGFITARDLLRCVPCALPLGLARLGSAPLGHRVLLA